VTTDWCLNRRNEIHKSGIATIHPSDSTLSRRDVPQTFISLMERNAAEFVEEVKDEGDLVELASFEGTATATRSPSGWRLKDRCPVSCRIA
jgi:hypothetical protein